MKKVIFLTLSLIASICTTQPMQPLGSKIGQWGIKSIAKKGFSGFMTQLQYGLGLLPVLPVIRELSGYSTKVTNTLFDADEEVSSFIRSQLAPSSIEKIKLDWKLGYNNMGVKHGNCIIISYSAQRKIKNALKEQNEQQLNVAKAILAHEHNHIKNNDYAYKMLAHSTIPIISFTAIETAATMKPFQSFILQQLIKVPSGLLALTISLTALNALSRHREQRADDQIPNNLDLLIGLKTDFEKQKKRETKEDNLIQKIFSSHPSWEHRIEKLNQRIALLEKSQQPAE